MNIVLPVEHRMNQGWMHVPRGLDNQQMLTLHEV